MGKVADIVLFSNSDANFNKRYAALVYACPASAFKVVSSFEDMAKTLGTYNSIGRLIFLLHGSSGDVIIKGVHKSLSQFTRLIKTKRIVVTKQVMLDGCNVGDYNGAIEMGRMLTFFKAPEIVGYAGYHHWDFLPIPAKSPVKNVQALLVKYDKFIVPGQGTAGQLAGRPINHKIVLEWFGQTSVKGPPPTTEVELHTTKSTRDLVKRRVKISDTAAFGAEMSGNPLALFEVTVVP